MLAATALFLQGAAIAAQDRDAAQPLDAGRNVYELALGTRAIEVSQAGGRWKASAAGQACRACHGDSGEGLSEGGIAAPPLATGPTSHADRVSWLSRALSDHRGTSGKELADAMPRYRIAPADLGALADYLGALPSAPTPGVTAREIRIFVDTSGSPLGASGQRALAEELRKSNETQRLVDGLFGRQVTYATSDDQAPPPPAIIDIVWRRDIVRPGRPALIVRSHHTATDSCGTLDPALPNHAAAIEDALAARRGPVQPGSIILEGDPAQIALAAKGGRAIYVAAEVAARLPAQDRPANMTILAPGDLARRTGVARTLLEKYTITAEQALAVAVYLEAIQVTEDSLKGMGRRLRRMALCDTVRQKSRIRQVVSVVTAENSQTIPLP